MMLGMLAWTGYWVGLGIELFIILVCAALLALMLTGLLFTWLANIKEQRAEQSAAKAIRAEVRAAEAEARAVAAEEAAALAEAQAEADAAERAAAAEEAAAVAKAKAEEEAAERAAAAEEAAAKKAAEKEAEKAAAEKAEAEKKAQAQAAKKPVISETEVVVEKKTEVVVEKKTEVVNEAAVADATEGESEFVVVHDGIVFNDSKTITELYEELSPEQQSYFDELREEALTKPDAELSISKNFVTVKIGKRNLIKLLIKRGVTVAEFMLENEALKQLRLSNTNKRGKSSIKVKPTVVQVLDLQSLKVAVDMINLAYEEMMLE